MYLVEGSNIPSVELSKPSLVQRVRTMRNKRVDSQSTPSPQLVHPILVRGNDSDKDLNVNQQLPLSLPPPPSSSDRMSTHLSLVHCPICDKSIRGYQVFMNHVLSHPFNNEMEIDIVQGSNNLCESLPTPSESVQHPRTMLMSPPPSSYDAHLIRGNDDGKIVLTNLKLPTPPPLSYHTSSMRVNIYDRDVNKN
ncbi:hypothetical protein RDI58_024712 [Solanum bulbocastanum]|uniref:Uncharacterized protein n=1 Tax=Solanum bulbocastanum TaxID=147425 RepID=A0AAN8T1S0_SOLBU